jgi:hypothetical protein
MPRPLSMPPGARLDLDLVIAVATRTNRVHQALGTELLHIGPGLATIALDWPAVLGDGSGHTHGVVTAVLDHVCSPRWWGSMTRPGSAAPWAFGPSTDPAADRRAAVRSRRVPERVRTSVVSVGSGVPGRRARPPGRVLGVRHRGLRGGHRRVADVTASVGALQAVIAGDPSL